MILNDTTSLTLRHNSNFIPTLTNNELGYLMVPAYKYIKIHILKEYDSTEKKEILMLIIQPPSIFFVYILKLKKFEQTTIK